MLFWLILLGVFTYFVVQRSVAGLTRTPVWLLWLVMMIPALSLVAWAVTQGAQPFPGGLMLALFVLCPLLYWGLIQAGRSPQSATAGPTPETPPPTPKPPLRPIDKEEEATLQHCFPWSIFYLQNIEYRPQALICRGQLRATPTVAYETVQENVKANFGDRFLVIFQEGDNGKPFFALVPNRRGEGNGAQPSPMAIGDKKTRDGEFRPALALGLLLLTLFTTTGVGAALAGVTEETLRADPSLLWQGLPYGVALLTILGVHELGHYLMARRHRIRATLPYFIPIPFFLGTFGAFIQLRSPIPNRRALFDVGIAGPLAGLVMTIPLLIWGLVHSEVVPLTDSASLLNFQALNPRASVALWLLIKLSLGSAVTADSAIALHPVGVAGCLGLVVTALNLIPVGQLDGGHIVHAMYGQRMGARIGQVARLLLLGLVFIHPELLIWAILLFFIPVVDEPALNDVTELDNQRDGWGLAALVLLILIVLPAPARFFALGG